MFPWNQLVCLLKVFSWHLKVLVSRVSSFRFHYSFAYNGPFSLAVWNSLPVTLQDSGMSLHTFKRRRKTYLFAPSGAVAAFFVSLAPLYKTLDLLTYFLADVRCIVDVLIGDSDGSEGSDITAWQQGRVLYNGGWWRRQASDWPGWGIETLVYSGSTLWTIKSAPF